MRSLSASSHRTRAGTRSSEATTRRGLAGELHIPAREPPVPIVVGRHCVRIADRDDAAGRRPEDELGAAVPVMNILHEIPRVVRGVVRHPPRPALRLVRSAPALPPW